jgi:hypothetical protein
MIERVLSKASASRFIAVSGAFSSNATLARIINIGRSDSEGEHGHEGPPGMVNV